HFRPYRPAFETDSGMRGSGHLRQITSVLRAASRCTAKCRAVPFLVNMLVGCKTEDSRQVSGGPQLLFGKPTERIGGFFEARERVQKNKIQLAGWAVALLGNNQVRLGALFFRQIGFVKPGPADEHD